MHSLKAFFKNYPIVRDEKTSLHVRIDSTQIEEVLLRLSESLEDEELYFIGEFLREIDAERDELILVFRYQQQYDLVLFSESSNAEPLIHVSKIFPAADLFEKEIYDYFGRDTFGEENYTLRLHSYPADFFPWRVIGRPMISEKKPFRFKKLPNKDVVEVPVGPIHAGIIPPGHFRFTVDGEDTLNLDICLGFMHRGVERYFMEERDLEKLRTASEEIVGDSVISHSLTFIRAIEELAGVAISEHTRLQRVFLLELERIYNHLWTIGAIHNDVGQAFILNGCLSVRESIMDLNEILFGSRTLRGILDFGHHRLSVTKNHKQIIIDTLMGAKKRFENLIATSDASIGIYDRLKDTGIVKRRTAWLSGALGLGAKASGIPMDWRVQDPYYDRIDVQVHLGEQGDAYDRMIVRTREVTDSIDRIIALLDREEFFEHPSEKEIAPLCLAPDRFVFSKTEGHRGENLVIIHTNAQGAIDYFKIKDPSFMNWTLLEYAVLNNIIADFPICNKSYDLSYCGFDL